MVVTAPAECLPATAAVIGYYMERFTRRLLRTNRIRNIPATVSNSGLLHLGGGALGPDNKPNSLEFARCRPYLVEELKLFENVRVVVVLGKIAFDSFLAAYRGENGGAVFQAEAKIRPWRLGRVAGRHPAHLLVSSEPQNTFTGKLTQPMFQAIFDRAKAAL